MIIADLVEYLDCVADCVALRPFDATIGSAVIETVLRPRSWTMLAWKPLKRSQHTTVEVNHDVQASTLSPVQSLAKLVVRALDEWLAIARDYTPVPDWDSHVVETSLGHLLEIVFGEERVPVLLESRLGGILTQDCAECSLVDSVVALKETGGDPGLEDKPSASVDSTDLLVVVVKGRRASYGVSVLLSAATTSRVVPTYRGDALELNASMATATAVLHCPTMAVCANDSGIIMTSNNVDKCVGRGKCGPLADGAVYTTLSKAPSPGAHTTLKHDAPSPMIHLGGKPVRPDPGWLVELSGRPPRIIRWLAGMRIVGSSSPVGMASGSGPGPSYQTPGQSNMAGMASQ